MRGGWKSIDTAPRNRKIRTKVKGCAATIGWWYHGEWVCENLKAQRKADREWKEKHSNTPFQRMSNIGYLVYEPDYWQEIHPNRKGR